jgi:hypothetical protein
MVFLFAVDHHRIGLDSAIRGEQYGAIAQTNSGPTRFVTLTSLFIGDPS